MVGADWVTGLGWNCEERRGVPGAFCWMRMTMVNPASCPRGKNDPGVEMFEWREQLIDSRDGAVALNGN